jgi:hypothetical protein
MEKLKLAAALAGLVLLAACADGPANTLAADPVAESQAQDTLTGLGEADDPLADGAGDMGGGGDSLGSEM